MKKKVSDNERTQTERIVAISRYWTSSMLVTRRKSAVAIGFELGFSSGVISDVVGISLQLCLKYISLYQEAGIEFLQADQDDKQSVVTASCYRDPTVDFSSLTADLITNTSLVRFAIISPLLQPSPKTLKERFREISNNAYLLPRGTFRQYSTGTIEDWYYEYKKHGINALNDPPRSDKDTHRTLTPAICQKIDTILEESPGIKGSKLISRLDALCLRKHGEPSDATVYRYISEVRPLHMTNAKQDTTNAAFWDRLAAAEWLMIVLFGAKSVQHFQKECESPAPFDLLIDFATNGSFLQRRTALCVLAHIRGISWNLIESLCGVSDDTLRRYRKYLEAGRVKELFQCKRRKDAMSKSENKKRLDAILQVIHAPPSIYDINRTTWTLPTIRQALINTTDICVSTATIGRIIRQAGLSWKRIRTKLTSSDPEYREKVKKITAILQGLGPRDRFFSVDEFGPFAIKARGGMTLMLKGETKTIPQRQKSRGSLILIGALELCTNQVTHFYSQKKNTSEMIKLLEILLYEYADQDCIYFSWDAASWHASKRLYEKVEQVNSSEYRKKNPGPFVKLAPLPTGAQFLNLIESVFSGMARAILHNSDYGSVMEAVIAIDRYFEERNKHFLENPKRAGKKIWGKERVPPVFKETNYCKDLRYR